MHINVPLLMTGIILTKEPLEISGSSQTMIQCRNVAVPDLFWPDPDFFKSLI